ncbi:hypothetical protein C0J26_06430 [Pseudomonas baetica]|nr:hypothetical protein C0J26_06430 [Pseudomonas baetica]
MASVRAKRTGLRRSRRWQHPAAQRSGIRRRAARRSVRPHCWSGLARESGVSFNDDVECYGLFASKPAPTGLAPTCCIFIVRSYGAVHAKGARPGHSRTETDCAPAP